MGLADLHIHTIYSYDGTASVPAVLARAKQIGLDVIAITDHDEIVGSLKALELSPSMG
jgi:predicted metal-dependent phosphoesterase TrpH